MYVFKYVCLYVLWNVCMYVCICIVQNVCGCFATYFQYICISISICNGKNYGL